MCSSDLQKGSVKNTNGVKRVASSKSSKKIPKLTRADVEAAPPPSQDDLRVKTKSAASKSVSTKPNLSQKKKKLDQSKQHTEPALETMMPGVEFGALAENMAELVDQGRKALAVALGGVDAEETRSELAASVADATKALGVVAEYWISKPERAAIEQAQLYRGLADIWQQTLMRYSGEATPPVVEADPADKRFASPEWQENPFFDWLRQSYLYTSRWAGELIDKTEGLDSQTRVKAAFYTRLISSAVSPSNFVPTNPELLRATVEAKGENLVRGFKMLVEDISAGHGILKIRQTDEDKFVLGVNMANTPGKVIWRNDVMELIQIGRAHV